MAAISSISAGGAFLFGLIMMGTNLTSLPLYISGLKEIVTAKIGSARTIFALVLFILLVVVELLVPVTVYALAPRRADALLSAARRWLEKNNRVITIFVFVVFGTLMLVRGVTALVAEFSRRSRNSLQHKLSLRAPLRYGEEESEMAAKNTSVGGSRHTT